MAAGGSRNGFAGLCLLFGVEFLVFGLLVSTDMLQPLACLLCGWCLVRLEQTGNERWWLALGAVVGVALLSKYLIAFFVVALAAGLLFTPIRRSLGASLGLSRRTGCAALMILPNLWWQAAHGWPFLELGKAGASGKNLELSPLDFLLQQLLFVGPLGRAGLDRGRVGGLRVAASESVARLRHRLSHPVRGLSWRSTAKLIISPRSIRCCWRWARSQLESWIVRASWRLAALGALIVSGLVMMPFAVPVLSEEHYIAYAAALGLTPTATATEHNRLGALPQHFADMHGWPQMAAKVAAVYHALPPADRAQAVFFGQDYGQSAAIDVFGAALGLPPAIGGHNNYYVWGPRGHDGSVLILVGGDPKNYARQFGSVTVAGATDDPYAMPYENRPIYVLRNMKVPLDDVLAAREALRIAGGYAGCLALAIVPGTRAGSISWIFSTNMHRRSWA